MARLATTAYTLGRSHTCSKCEYSNIPCTFDEAPEPTSPSVGIGLAPHVRVALLEKKCARHEADAERLAIQNRELKEELIRRNQEIEDLRLMNRNLSRKIVEDARKRGEAATQQPSWPRRIHGS